jgi:hypothetical protein
MLALGSSGANASLSDYQTLYLSGAQSSVLPTSYTLVTSPGPGAPTAAPTVTPYVPDPVPTADGLFFDCLNSYDYEYTYVDATGGETSPSPVSAALTWTDEWAEIDGLPTGVSIRLYRQCDSGAFVRVADLPNNSSSTYFDEMDDAAAQGQPVLPQSQTQIPYSASSGYQQFAPGQYAPVDPAYVGNPPLDSPMDPGPLTTPNGKGWIVDGSGGVSFPTGTWTFKANVQQPGGTGIAHLAVGMWKVTVSGGAITSSTMLLDPTGAGESSTNFIGASGPITHSVTVNAFSLAPNQHLYVQFWRRQISSPGGATLATMNVYDGTAQITHPAADGFPNLPTLNSPADALRTNNSAPPLSANYTDPDPDNGTVSFQLCSDSACSSVVQSGTSATIASGANGTWTPSTLADGTYYWRAQATDTASNVSGWTATRSFTVDTAPPSAPTLGAPANAARVTSGTLHATFLNPDPTDSGTVSFQLCSDAACAAVLQSTTSGSVTNGTAVTWTPAGLSSGTTYYWRLRATDAVGNQTAWSATRSFVYDTNAPGVPTLTNPAGGASVTATPTFAATFSANGDAGDTGTIAFRLASDSACTAIVASGSSASGLANGTSGTWTPTGLALGSYYWCAQAQDAAGNTSAWSSASPFTLASPPAPPSGGSGGSSNPPPPSPPPVDTTPPDPPVTLSPPGSAVERKLHLGATFPASENGSGTLQFEVCADAACTTVLVSGSSGLVAPGAAATWSPPSALRDSAYFWRVRSVDAVGNASSWSPVRRVVLDATPPGRPRHFHAVIRGKTITLRWTPPADAKAVRGYALLVDGRHARDLKPTLRSLRILLRPKDNRTFALASFDAAGNLSASTQGLPVRVIRQAQRLARASKSTH